MHQKPDNTVSIDIDAGYRSPEDAGSVENNKAFVLYFEGTDTKPEITINRIAYKAKSIKKDGKTVWTTNPYDQQAKLEKTMVANELVKN